MLLATVLAANYVAAHLEVNFTTQALFVSSDPRLVRYLEFTQTYGADDVSCYLAVELDDALSRESLLRIAGWCRRLERLPGVRTVYAPSQPLGGALPLLDPEHASDPQLELHRAFVREGAFARLLLSDDAKVAGILIEKWPRAGGEAPDARLVDGLWDLVREIELEGAPAHLTGVPVLEQEYITHIQTDQARFLPLMLVVCLVLMYLLFRTIRVAWALVAVASSVVWAAWCLAIFGVAIDITNHVISVLVLYVSASTCIHVMARHEEEHRPGTDPVQAMITALRRIGAACFLNTFTTAAGFLSLVVVDNPSVRQLAIHAPLALLSTFAVCMAMMPLLTMIAGPLAIPGRPTSAERARPLLSRLHRWGARWPRAVLAASLAACVLAGVGIARIERRAEWLAMLGQDNRLRQGNDFFEQQMAGIIPIECLLTPPREGPSFAQPEAMAALLDFERALAADAAVGARKTLSLASFVAALYGHAPYLASRLGPRLANEAGAQLPLAALAELAQPATGRTPRHPALLAGFLTLPAGADDAAPLHARYLAHEGRGARVTVLLPDSAPERIRAAALRIESVFRASSLARDWSLEITGGGLLVSGAMDRLTHDLLASLVSIYAIVFVTLVILYRSLNVGLVSLVPNAIPVVMSMGLMPAFDLPMNFSVAVIFSIGVGIAVDDTIHFLARYVEVLPACATQEQALEATMLTTGQPIYFTSILLAGGFAVLFTSEFKTAHTFATLGLLITVSTLAGDLFTLPSIIRVFGFAPGLGSGDPAPSPRLPSP